MEQSCREILERLEHFRTLQSMNEKAEREMKVCEGSG